MNKNTRIKTKPHGYLFNRSYYYIEDGECSLNNMIVRKRLRGYIFKTIKRYRWIFKKNFADPEDIFLAVQEDIENINPKDYGNGEVHPITFLTKKIRYWIGKLWEEYYKTSNPAGYKEYLHRSKIRDRNYRSSDAGKACNRRLQKKMRDGISDHYVLQLVYSNLKNQTGVAYTFNEIREQYPYLIKQKKENLLNQRRSRASGEIPTENYISMLVRQQLLRKGINLGGAMIREKYPELIKEKAINILKNRGLPIDTIILPALNHGQRRTAKT